jgi:hypothetical protein
MPATVGSSPSSGRAFDLGGLPAPDADRIRERLAKLDRACGCTLGAAVALTATAMYVLAVVIGPGRVAGSWWATLALGTAVFLAGVGVGKSLGLTRARRQRQRLLDDLAARDEVEGGRATSDAS